MDHSSNIRLDKKKTNESLTSLDVTQKYTIELWSFFFFFRRT